MARPLLPRLLLFVGLAGQLAPAGESPRPSELTTSQVLERLLTLNDKVRAWSIEYQGATDLAPYYTHRTVAARYPDACRWNGAKSRLNFEVAGDIVGTDWRENDIFQNWMLVASDRSTWCEPKNRAFGKAPIARDAPLPVKLQGELLFLALGWWPFEGRPEPEFRGGGSYVIPGIARSGRYVVAQEMELRGGRWCHILEDPGRDRLWVDAGIGPAIVAREVSDRETGEAIQALEMGDFRDAGQGIWAPREIRNVVFDREASRGGAGPRPRLDSRLRILAVAVNDSVDGRLFEPDPFSPGMLEVRDDGSYRQAVPGGAGHMDELAARLERQARAAGPAPAAAGPTRAALNASLIALGLVVVGLSWYRRGSRLADERPRAIPAGAGPAPR